MNHKKLTRWGNTAAILGLIVSTVSATLLITVPATAADDTGSSQTIDWAATHTDTSDPNYDSFKDLKVSVSQTENLVNQGVTVEWSGAKTTSSGEYASDYMQLMQCWGEASDGPTPQTCQWGAPTSTLGNLMGSRAASRSLARGEDPAQVYSTDLLRPAPVENPNQKAYSFPFSSVKGNTSFDQGQFFDSVTTNEISAARTGSNGTGLAVFETQTSLEAPDLGCGALVAGEDGKQAPRSCWLVMVPRGSINADGSAAGDQPSGRITGSPFTATNWKNRVVFKLGFQSVASSCPIGNAERRVVGTELIADAITSWQPALCGTGTTYGYSQIGDGEARRQIVSGIDGSSGLGFVSDPLDTATLGSNTVTYAPVAQTSVVIGFNIDYSLKSDSPNFADNGTQVKSLTLNARLVAKLLTQSYRGDVPGLGTSNPAISKNPTSIATDPEFLTLNPAFAGFTSLAQPDGLLVALGSSDAAAHVWQWIRADKNASAFLAGTADENGMQINPSYKTLLLNSDTTVDSFPKADLTTYRDSAAVPEPGFGTLDLRPYMNDMQEAAYRARRADANVKTTWDETKAPPAFVSSGPQLPGQRFMLAITDASSAARYGLNNAKLVNSNGEAIEPTSDSVQKGIAAMVKSSVDGVKVSDPSVLTPGAYPLSMLTYAAVNVCSPSNAELKDYAGLLSYAVGKGQVNGDARGQLPVGYVPLDKTQTAQTASVITTLKAQAAGTGKLCKVAEVPATDTTTPPATEETPTSDFPTDTAADPEEAPAAPATTAPATNDPEVVAEKHNTKDEPLGAGRLGLLAALALGLPTMIAGPIFSRRGRKLAKLSEIE